MHFIDVGYGDCILIEFPDDTKALIDTASEKKVEKVIKYLEKSFYYSEEE